MVHCPFCNRNPEEISWIKFKADLFEMSPSEYVRMNDPSYHIKTDMFICNQCYFDQGLPTWLELIQAYNEIEKEKQSAATDRQN